MQKGLGADQEAAELILGDPWGLPWVGSSDTEVLRNLSIACVTVYRNSVAGRGVVRAVAQGSTKPYEF